MWDRKRHWRALVVCLLASFTALPAAARAESSGALDTSFGTAGFSTVTYGSKAVAAATIVQPNGDIVTVGEAWEASGQAAMIFTRMTPVGKLDASFGQGGIVIVPVGDASGVDSGAALALEPGGQIVAVGTGQGSRGLEFAAVRLNSDGSLDSTFGSGGVALVPIGYSAIATAVVIQPNGYIVLGGAAASGSHIYFAAARLTPSGSLDATFGTGGVSFLTGQPPGGAWGMVLQSNGRIVLAGTEQPCSGCSSSYMALGLQQNGQLDNSFANNGVFRMNFGGSALGLGAALAPSGDILFTGQAHTSSGGRVATVALSPDGSLDPSFGTDGVSSFAGSGVNAIAVDSSGRIDLAGVGASVVRLNPSGSIDTSFSGGVGFYCNGRGCAANGIAFQPTDGKVVLAGATAVNGTYGILVVRVNP